MASGPQASVSPRSRRQERTRGSTAAASSAERQIASAASRGFTRAGWGSAASRDGGDDRDRIAFLEGGRSALEEPHVLVVDVEVDEPAQLALLVHEPLAQARELAFQVLHHVVDGLALDRHLGVSLADRPQGGGNSNDDGHRPPPDLTNGNHRGSAV